jgi:hypothetical protein
MRHWLPVEKNAAENDGKMNKRPFAGRSFEPNLKIKQ